MEYIRRYHSTFLSTLFLFLMLMMESSIGNGLKFVVERGKAGLPDKIVNASDPKLLRTCSNNSLFLASSNATLSCQSIDQLSKSGFGSDCTTEYTLQEKHLIISNITIIRSLKLWNYQLHREFPGGTVQQFINITTSEMIFTKFDSWKGLLVRIDYSKNIGKNESKECLLLRFPGNRAHPLPRTLEQILAAPISQTTSTQPPSKTSPTASITDATTQTTSPTTSDTTTTTTTTATTTSTATTTVATTTTLATTTKTGLMIIPQTTLSTNNNDIWEIPELKVMNSTTKTFITKKNHINMVLMVVCGVTGVGIFCLIIAIVCIYWQRMKLKKQREDEANRSIPMGELDETRQLLNVNPPTPNNTALYEPVSKNGQIQDYEKIPHYDPVKKYNPVQQHDPLPECDQVEQYDPARKYDRVNPYYAHVPNYDDPGTEYEPVGKYNPKRNHVPLEIGDSGYASVQKSSENDILLVTEHEPSREKNGKRRNNYEILPHEIMQGNDPTKDKRNYENIDDKMLNSLYDEPISKPLLPNSDLYAVVDKSKKGI